MPYAGTGVVGMTALRELCAAALAPIEEGDPPVTTGPVDSIEPPALMVLWDDPMLTSETSRLWRARLAVYCFAGRVEPDEGFATLERLTDHVAARLRADRYTWPFATARAPRLLEVARIPLLVTRLIYACPVTIGG
jgi:hypothetical protein